MGPLETALDEIVRFPARAVTPKRLLLGLLGVGLVAGATLFFAFGYESRSERDFRFVRTVLLTREGGDQTPVVARWVKPVAIALDSQDEEAERIVRDLVGELADVLGPNFVRLTDPSDARVWIMVESRYFIEFFLSRRGETFAAVDTAFTEMRFASDWSIIDGFVLVDSGLPPALKRAALAQELTQALGPMGDSPVYPESVMFETDREGSTAIALAPIDRKVLRFLYRHLKPGDDEAAVRAAFERYWDSVPSD